MPSLHISRIVHETISCDFSQGGVTIGHMIDNMIQEALENKGQVMEIGVEISQEEWNVLRSAHQDMQQDYSIDGVAVGKPVKTGKKF